MAHPAFVMRLSAPLLVFGAFLGNAGIAIGADLPVKAPAVAVTPVSF